jgi:hypothetical protein
MRIVVVLHTRTYRLTLERSSMRECADGLMGLIVSAFPDARQGSRCESG